MSTYDRKRVRIGFNVQKDSLRPTDYDSGEAPHTWRGVDLDIECGFFLNDGTPIDLTNYSSVTIEVKVDALPATSPIMTKTVTSGSINTGMTAAQWADGTACHVSFRFANTETAPNLGGLTSVSYYVVVTGLTSLSTKATLGVTSLTIEEDGHGTDTTPPLGPDTYPTLAEVVALIAAARIDTGHVYNQTLAKWVPVQLQGPAEAPSWVYGTPHD